MVYLYRVNTLCKTKGEKILFSIVRAYVPCPVPFALPRTLALRYVLSSGASIREGTLKDLDANSPAIAVAPACHVAFAPEEECSANGSGDDDNSAALEDDTNSRKDCLSVPVYTTVQREALICSLPIACPREERDAWLRRGVVLYLRS